jgi:FkbM family methyltransferase
MSYNEPPLYFPAGPKGVNAIKTTNLYRQRILLDPRDLYITLHYLEHHDWEEHLNPVYEEAFKENAVYIDAGANIGLHVLRAFKYGCKKAFAFEPDPITFELLKLNTKINGFYDAVLVNKALGNQNGEIGFKVNEISTGMSCVSNKDYDYTVPIISFDNDYAHESLENILIKIDVEGHEGEVIEGMLNTIKLSKSATLIIEFGSYSSKQSIKSLFSLSTWTAFIYRWKKDPQPISPEELFSWEEHVDLILIKG